MNDLTKLTKIYETVCNEWEKTLKFSVQRFSNNDKPKFTDQEVMTIMLYCTSIERRRTVKEIHSFASTHLKSWFPLIPSYVAFNNRKNFLSEAFRLLASSLLQNNVPSNCSEEILMIDSMPIITCSGKRHGKVATEITDKSYCASKSIYYYGVKLHLLGSRVKGTLPHPAGLIITPASESDLNVYRDYWCNHNDTATFADKAYRDSGTDSKLLVIGSEVLTPVKYSKGVPDAIKQFNKAADDLYSRAVSAIRQPVESLFSWFIEKSDIQRASKVRSTRGLIVHIFNKLAAIYLKKLILNP